MVMHRDQLMHKFSLMLVKMRVIMSPLCPICQLIVRATLVLMVRNILVSKRERRLTTGLFMLETLTTLQYQKSFKRFSKNVVPSIELPF